jgi:hypothetical protein
MIGGANQTCAYKILLKLFVQPTSGRNFKINYYLRLQKIRNCNLRLRINNKNQLEKGEDYIKK